MPVTLLLVGAMLALEWISLTSPARRDFLYDSARLAIWWQVWEGQWWRPFTTALLHGGVLHLLMNLSAMFAFAPTLEVRLGSFRLATLVVLLAYVSTLGQYMIGNYSVPLAEQTTMVGFSGVLFGLAGVLFVGRHFHPDLEAALPSGTTRFFAFWFIICVVLTWFWKEVHIGNIAHGAGFLFGALYGMAIFAPNHRRRWIASSVVLTALVLSSMWAMPGHVAYENYVPHDLGS